jgi:hypothetical protein
MIMTDSNLFFDNLMQNALLVYKDIYGFKKENETCKLDNPIIFLEIGIEKFKENCCHAMERICLNVKEKCCFLKRNLMGLVSSC